MSDSISGQVREITHSEYTKKHFKTFVKLKINWNIVRTRKDNERNRSTMIGFGNVENRLGMFGRDINGTTRLP